MKRLAWIGAVLLATTVGAAADNGVATSGQPAEMQARREGGAMTAQRARRECWQSFGVGPSTPRNQYPARLQPQVEACIAQKMNIKFKHRL